MRVLRVTADRGDAICVICFARLRHRETDVDVVMNSRGGPIGDGVYGEGCCARLGELHG
jgi:hypothetical protein